jgi:hypothetical protein
MMAGNDQLDEGRTQAQRNAAIGKTASQREIPTNGLVTGVIRSALGSAGSTGGGQ